MGTLAVTTAAASIAAIDMERTLTQLPFWSSLTEQEQETLRRSAFVRHYEKGAFIHSSDNECLGMLFVLSGEIRTYLLSEEGREVTLFRLYPGELCVLSASCVISQITFDTQMTAGMDTDVLIVPANVIAALKEQNLHVRCFLYELATKRFSDVMWAMQQIMFKGLDRRLADFLLAEAGIKLYGGVSGDADAAVSALLNGNLGYDPNVHCDHHDHEHGEAGHTCGDHGCGKHSCH